MRYSRASRRRLRSLIVGATVAAVASAALPAAGTPSPQDDGEVLSDRWLGFGIATGSAVATESGVTVDWRGEVKALVRFSLDPENGAADGTWQLTGDATQTLSGQGRSATALLDYTGGGALAGDRDVLVLTGSVTTSGSGGIFEVPTNTNETPPLEVPITRMCDELYGDWPFALKQGFEGAGFDAEMDGVLVVLNRANDGFSDVGVELLAEHGIDVSALARDDDAFDELRALGGALLEFGSTVKALVDRYPDWTRDDVAELRSKADAFVNVLRNLSDCVYELAEDEIRKFLDLLGEFVKQLLDRIPDVEWEAILRDQDPEDGQDPGEPDAPENDDDPEDGGDEPASSDSTAAVAQSYQLLVLLSLRSGVIGSGAADDDAAEEGERTLIVAGSSLLEAIDDGDSPGRIPILTAGALMDWTFTVDGQDVVARAALAEELGAL